MSSSKAQTGQMSGSGEALDSDGSDLRVEKENGKKSSLSVDKEGHTRKYSSGGNLVKNEI